MKKRIFRAIFMVAVVVLLASLLLVTSFLYRYFNRLQVGHLQSELHLVAETIEAVGDEYLAALTSDTSRFTLIAQDGTVLFDSQVDANTMENHRDREEIREARESGSGSSIRYSSTLTERTCYESMRLSDGRVLRGSISERTIGGLIVGMFPTMLVILLAAAAVSLLFSGRMAKRIIAPLEQLDLEKPADNDAYKELTPILAKINRQHKQIRGQMELLGQRADELSQIISAMSEGLVLLDECGRILSINAAARQIFGVPEGGVGCDFLTIDRSPAIGQAITAALAGKHGALQAEKNGRTYQFDISRIESGGKTLGVVVLGFDVTERVLAEQRRREFTANVSHELKTPLQSIVGSAELLENDLVRPEDTRRFIGNIHSEAQRMVSLINDIIRLSQLDEEGELSGEPVDLYMVAEDVVDVLSAAAGAKRVTLSLDGVHSTICGVRRYLYEILYNLCDNAIRYNIEGGSVRITIGADCGGTVVTVADTGIGIASEHQPRIFERFYRADKSHSRETGGTGLGLSIVKHAVQYHGGRIELESAVGRGTTVRVLF